MPTPNYQFAKRQRELKKSQKQEQKRQKKLAQQAQQTQPTDSPPGKTTPGA